MCSWPTPTAPAAWPPVRRDSGGKGTRGEGAHQVGENVSFRHRPHPRRLEPTIDGGAENGRGLDAARKGRCDLRSRIHRCSPGSWPDGDRLVAHRAKGSESALAGRFFPQGLHADVALLVTAGQQGIVRDYPRARPKRQGAQGGFAAARQPQDKDTLAVEFVPRMHDCTAVAGEGVTDGKTEQSFKVVGPVAEKGGGRCQHLSSTRRDVSPPLPQCSTLKLSLCWVRQGCASAR